MNHLRKYSTFSSISELNDAVNKHERYYQAELQPTERAVLRIIAQHSVKYIGVSQLKHATIAAYVDRSVSTVRRALRKLARLSIIEKVPMLRLKTGGYGATVFRIMPNDHSNEHSPNGENPQSTAPDSHNEETETFSKANKSISHISNGARTLKQTIPAALHTLTAVFDFEQAYRYIGVIYRAKASIDCEMVIEHHAQEYNDTIAYVLDRYRRGNVRSLADYLYAAIQSITAVIKRREHANRRPNLLRNN